MSVFLIVGAEMYAGRVACCLSLQSLEIGWEERLRNDLLCVGCDVKPKLIIDKSHAVSW